MRCLFILVILLSSIDTMAGDGFFSRLAETMNRNTRRGLDTNFVKVPDNPWQVIVKGNIDQVDLHFKSNVSAAEAFGNDAAGNIRWDWRMRTPITFSTGVWVGYRGYGLGLTKTLGNAKGSYLSLGMSNAKYALSFRYRKNKISDTDIMISGDVNGTPIDTYEHLHAQSPISSSAFIADFYYFFNGSKYSFDAAFKQPVVQLRSAGSFFAGAMYFSGDADYADESNASFVTLMDDIGRFKTMQASIGAGYAYNYVPAEGWVIGGLLMPMVTLLNQSKTYRYDTSNGGFVKGDIETQNNPIDYNIDGRMAVTRCWEDWFVSVTGQLNHFYYRQKHTRGQTTDWFVTLSVGTRF